MPERVSNTDIRLRIRLCENSLGRGDPHHMALLDLLDARAEVEKLANGVIGLSADILRLTRERDEARPIVEAAMRQYEAAAPCGWIGAWWLNPAFQTAAIQLHVTCEAAARAAEGGGDE